MTTRSSSPGRSGHGGLAVGLAALALVAAGGGAAVAVTATTTIVGGNNGAFKASVDNTGKLQTMTPTSRLATIAVTSAGFQPPANDRADLLSSPTTATLAVTGLDAAVLRQTSSLYRVFLYQVATNPDGTCAVTTPLRTVAVTSMTPNGPAALRFPNPLQVKPVGGAPYCLDLYIQPIGVGSTGTEYAAQISAYVVSGSYVGVGT